ncbi:hypothetical protein [Planococcus shenhongbingii]|uniref:Uncharacterized protein n=1 Tax=Planococcus shenhongbingii TaxID=3058398 RepID=A0ABT8NDH8_9BACL|nr:hypothetical protein [Planococcus sp. N017]MDN7245570.1 hypothetical protein [Planococcus sp. N017]
MEKKEFKAIVHECLLSYGFVKKSVSTTKKAKTSFALSASRNPTS